MSDQPLTPERLARIRELMNTPEIKAVSAAAPPPPADAVAMLRAGGFPLTPREDAA